MADAFSSTHSKAEPATSGFAVTKSDETVFQQPTRAVYVGGAGNLAVRMIDGSQPIFASVPAGSMLPIRVDKVLETGTTASNIVGLY